jgi:hypothetical protein
VLTVEITVGELEGASEAFAAAPDRLKIHMREAMVESLKVVLKGALDRVHVISGTLRRSITAARPEENSEGGFDGRVGTNLAYARAEEFGFRGEENVRGYSRRVRGRDVREARKMVAAGVGFVSPHTRRINRPPHPYLVPALEAARDAIIQAHGKAIEDTFADVKGQR